MTDFIEAVRERISELDPPLRDRVSPEMWELLTNWNWPAPEVPQGWADWFAHGDKS